jgi:hypothetical protein
VADVSRMDALRFHLRADLIDENTGHFKLTFRAGRWTLIQMGNHAIQSPVVGGIYTGSARIVILRWQYPGTDTGSTTCRWRFDALSRTLALTVLRSDPDAGTSVGAATALTGDRTIFQSHPWMRIG